MATQPPTGQPDFEVHDDGHDSETLLAGFSQFGLAGLTALDYLVDQLDLEPTGYVISEDFPSITPFENGTPRHHTRLFSGPDTDVTVLVGELFVPVWAARPLGDAVLAWSDQSTVEEIAVLSGVPIPHGPEAHRTFYVATEDYRRRRLEDGDVPAMGSGFLDGINAALVERGIDSELAVGVYVTPVHEQVPDVEAAIRLLETVTTVYDIDVDTAPLEGFAADVRQYYEDLAARYQAASEAELPEDRMYM
jgi:uncharacterized protein